MADLIRGQSLRRCSYSSYFYLIVLYQISVNVQQLTWQHANNTQHIKNIHRFKYEAYSTTHLLCTHYLLLHTAYTLHTHPESHTYTHTHTHTHTQTHTDTHTDTHKHAHTVAVVYITNLKHRPTHGKESTQEIYCDCKINALNK